MVKMLYLLNKITNQFEDIIDNIGPSFRDVDKKRSY
jgi:hypothetical protein